MPSRSEAQRKMIFARRNKYKTKETTPEKWKWIWFKEYENKGELPEKVEESLLNKYLNKIYNEEPVDDESNYIPIKNLKLSDFHIFTDDVGTGKRGLGRKVYVTYTDSDTGNAYEGEIIMGYGSRGRGESYPYVSHIEWDSFYNDGKEPDNTEDIEMFVDQHLDTKTMRLI